MKTEVIDLTNGKWSVKIYVDGVLSRTIIVNSFAVALRIVDASR